jgi:ArsR family transcriptional regulator
MLELDAQKAARLARVIPAFDDATGAAERAHALADATRLQLAALLAADERVCVSDLATLIGRDKGVASHHLRVLARAGLASRYRWDKNAYYSLTETGRALLEATLRQPGAEEYRSRSRSGPGVDA